MLTIYLVVGMIVIILSLKDANLEDTKRIFKGAETKQEIIILYTVFVIGAIVALTIWPLLVLCGFVKGMTE